jgi:uncharacterized membrane protein
MIHALQANTTTRVDGEALFLDLLPWLGLILLLVVILVGTIYIGRRLLSQDESGSEQPFTLQSLRELHASGQLSDEEFERARAAMIAQVKAAAARSDKQGDEASEADDEAGDEPAEPSDESSDNGGDQPGQADNNRDTKPRDGTSG